MHYGIIWTCLLNLAGLKVRSIIFRYAVAKSKRRQVLDIKSKRWLQLILIWRITTFPLGLLIHFVYAHFMRLTDLLISYYLSRGSSLMSDLIYAKTIVFAWVVSTNARLYLLFLFFWLWVLEFEYTFGQFHLQFHILKH